MDDRAQAIGNDRALPGGNICRFCGLAQDGHNRRTNSPAIESRKAFKGLF
ncbi:hypothetical protein GPNCGGLF_LOCUS1847 [Methylorubrum aminovorans]